MTVKDGTDYLYFVHCRYWLFDPAPHNVSESPRKVFRLVSGWLVGIDGFNSSNRISDEVGRE